MTRRPLLFVLLVACGGAQSPAGGPAESPLRAFAAADLRCAEASISLLVIGEGDSSTGETVPVYRAAGCGGIGEYFCDRDGCQRNGAVASCDPALSWPDRWRECDGCLNVRRNPQGPEGYDLDDVCADAPP